MEELEIITSYDEEKLLMSYFELVVKEYISELEYCEVFQDKEYRTYQDKFYPDRECEKVII